VSPVNSSFGDLDMLATIDPVALTVSLAAGTTATVQIDPRPDPSTR
jgi:hypothetical protein